MTNKEYAASLRQLADFYEEHPMLAVPYETHLTVYGYNTKEEVLAVATILGRCKKVFNEHCFYLVKEFGELKLRFYFSRELVCEKIVVGTRVTPALSYPEQTEEVIEWRCIPLLKE